MRLVSNARMYAVTPAVERRWAELLTGIGVAAGIELAYEAFPAPAPLDRLWARDDLGLAFMCGWPFAALHPGAQPVVAPRPSAEWAGGHSCYRTDLVVASASSFHVLSDTFHGRIGWTVEHSQSGCRALGAYLNEARGGGAGWQGFRERVGPLVTPRRVVDALLAGEIDVGPLDAYWHELLKLHEPGTASRLRTIDTTRLTPMPLLVASEGISEKIVGRLQGAATLSATDPVLRPILDELGLIGFVAVTRADYDVLRSESDS